eukprot:TRINITY_DN1645_c0_g1_i1.p1 TRINITY_DN1645_c0_g1~~TRINITY_DN1645_c0_g1_i1.p1  ORF type:complete len:710 (+),score=164.14 TRINITY_DN1645_c0_g1_i1:1-2130(+)
MCIRDRYMGSKRFCSQMKALTPRAKPPIVYVRTSPVPLPPLKSIHLTPAETLLVRAQSPPTARTRRGSPPPPSGIVPIEMVLPIARTETGGHLTHRGSPKLSPVIATPLAFLPIPKSEIQQGLVPAVEQIAPPPTTNLIDLGLIEGRGPRQRRLTQLPSVLSNQTMAFAIGGNIVQTPTVPLRKSNVRQLSPPPTTSQVPYWTLSHSRQQMSPPGGSYFETPGHASQQPVQLPLHIAVPMQVQLSPKVTQQLQQQQLQQQAPHQLPQQMPQQFQQQLQQQLPQQMPQQFQQQLQQQLPQHLPQQFQQQFQQQLSQQVPQQFQQPLQQQGLQQLPQQMPQQFLQHLPQQNPQYFPPEIPPQQHHETQYYQQQQQRPEEYMVPSEQPTYLIPPPYQNYNRPEEIVHPRQLVTTIDVSQHGTPYEKSEIHKTPPTHDQRIFIDIRGPSSSRTHEEVSPPLEARPTAEDTQPRNILLSPESNLYQFQMTLENSYGNGQQAAPQTKVFEISPYTETPVDHHTQHSPDTEVKELKTADDKEENVSPRHPKTERRRFVTQTFEDGSRYEGEKIEDIRQGRGRFTWANGETYDGEWNDDIRSGYGILWALNGSKIYEGEWRNDMFEGKGTLNNLGALSVPEDYDHLKAEDLELYITCLEGDFVHGKFTGRGTAILSDGSRFWGQFNQGRMQGLASFQNPEGDIFIGEWSNNKLIRQL